MNRARNRSLYLYIIRLFICLNSLNQCANVSSFTSVPWHSVSQVVRLEISRKAAVASKSKDEGTTTSIKGSTTITNKSLGLKRRRRGNGSATRRRNSNKEKPVKNKRRLLYNANVHNSKRTQKLIQQTVSRISKQSLGKGYTASTAVLDVLLKADNYNEINEMNILFALISSVKLLPSSSITLDVDGQRVFRRQMLCVSRMLNTLLDDAVEGKESDSKRKQNTKSSERLSTRQLANAAWALVKVLDHLSPRSEIRLYIEHMLERIGMRITQKLEQSRSLDENPNLFSAIELSMIAGAYTRLYPRDLPVGWKYKTGERKIEGDCNIDNYNSDERSIRFEAMKFSETCEETRELNSYDALFEAIANDIIQDVISLDCYEWNTLSNILWAFAHRGYQSKSSELLATKISKEVITRLSSIIKDKGLQKPPLSRDISILSWSLGVMQVDNFRLGESFEEYIRVVSEVIKSDSMKASNDKLFEFSSWSSSDLVQLASSLAHGRVDDISLLEQVFAEAVKKVKSKRFKSWEIVVLIWVIAKLDLTYYKNSAIKDFLHTSIATLLQRSKDSDLHTLGGLGSQEQANLAWSLTVLEMYSPNSLELLQHVFHAASCNDYLQPEHAHQLWQALFTLERECSSRAPSVPLKFRTFLRQKWREEKNRKKDSSARHKALSHTLSLMGITHFNEYDEDIDVAMILPQKSIKTNKSNKEEQNKSLVRHVAVEFDGPSHFVRDGRRPLGETLLKYRCLKLQGWDVVRVPYQEFDKIPFWASMERQRYVQRKLKTHESIRFSEVDVSDYSEIPDDRRSRFD